LTGAGGYEQLFDAPPRPPAEVVPGAVHVPDWLTIGEQRELVVACQEWAKPPAPMAHTKLPGGGVMSVQTVCLGWHWLPYRYSRRADNVDGQAVTPFPGWLVALGRRAVVAAGFGDDSAASYEPDAALVNLYDATAKMGLHQDKDEKVNAPVVSLSLGDSCVFRFGNTENRNRPFADIELRSGDLFVFAGPARFAFHGVTKILPNTGPSIGCDGSRLNITLRQTGLTD
jgi:DNA oxidative demethylase